MSVLTISLVYRNIARSVQIPGAPIGVTEHFVVLLSKCKILSDFGYRYALILSNYIRLLWKEIGNVKVLRDCKINNFQNTRMIMAIFY